MDTATTTMREARQRYFEDNHFGNDGGYEDPWVDFKLGPVPFPIPNTAGRKRAVRYHDLHHLVTGYRTDIVGEFEISAWEIGGGCRDLAAAWVLNLSGMAGGMLVAPRRTWRAFVRGRHSSTLYDREFEPLLDRTVDDVRNEMGTDRSAVAEPMDAAWFVVAGAAGFAVGTAFMALAIPVVPLGLAWQVAKRVTPGTR